MSEGILSQAEIDALLNDTEPNKEQNDNNQLIDNTEIDAIGEIGNISMGTAATTLSSLLGKKVEITTPTVELTSKDKLREEYPRPYVIIDVKYTDGLKGNNLLVISIKDAGVIADLMMGGNGENPPGELTELHMSAVTEAMNQMMGSSSTSMSTVLNKRIDISPPLLNMVDLEKQDVGFAKLGSDEPLIKVSFRMVIQGLVDSQLMQLIPVNFAKIMIQELFSNFTEESETGHAQQIIEEPEPESYPSFTNNTQMEYADKQEETTKQSIAIQPAQFAQLNPQTVQTKPQNLDLILDVPLNISVELGRTNKSIREILEFSAGSIIELNKLAGEPVDMMINGKLFAKGEVVVIDENFGVRITDIISPMERVKNLQ